MIYFLYACYVEQFSKKQGKETSTDGQLLIHLCA